MAFFKKLSAIAKRILGRGLQEYITITAAQLRTKSGNKAGTTQIDAVVTLSGKTIWMYDDTWHEISSSNYLGKYIQMKYLREYAPPPPPSDIYVTHIIKVFSNGSIEVDGQPFP